MTRIRAFYVTAYNSHGAELILLSTGLGLYILEGELKSIKRMAAFSKTITICCDKNKPIVTIGKNQFKKEGKLYWQHYKGKYDKD